MPALAGFEPRFDEIPALRGRQPAEVVRPLYWWAKDLRANGDILTSVHFHAVTMEATVTARLASYQVAEVARRHDDKPRLPRDLLELIAEAVWRLGALGWAEELTEAILLLRTLGLIAAPAAMTPRTRHIPGWVQQPDRGGASPTGGRSRCSVTAGGSLRAARRWPSTGSSPRYPAVAVIGS
jgi:hypothetical protein